MQLCLWHKWHLAHLDWWTGTFKSQASHFYHDLMAWKVPEAVLNCCSEFGLSPIRIYIYIKKKQQQQRPENIWWSAPKEYGLSKDKCKFIIRRFPVNIKIANAKLMRS